VAPGLIILKQIMKLIKLLLFAFFASGIIIVPFKELYSQFSQFGGPNRNGVYPATGLMDSWPDEGPRMIEALTGIGEGFGSPTITENGIYIAGMIDSVGFVFHFDHDHNIKWKTEIGKEFTLNYVGARGTPTIEGNRLYYVASLGDAVCLNATTGEKIWYLNIFEEFQGPHIKWGYTESPLIYGEKIFFTPGGPGSNFVALDKMNGELIWASDIDSTFNSYCSPVIINHNNKNLILLNSSYAILLIDPDIGDVIVKHPLSANHFNHAIPPLYTDGKLFYSSGYGGGATLFRIIEGETELDTIYTNNDFDCKLSGMIVYDGTVFGVSDRRKQWVGVDLNSGETLFTSRDIKPGSLIMADNKFYMFSDIGEVALAFPSENGFEIVSRFQIPAENVKMAFAHPVIYNDILYIRYNNNLWLYRI
jgi:outer membrane protein assembly factor BamB